MLLFPFWEKRSGAHIRQYIYILLIQVLGLSSLYVINEDLSHLFHYFLQIAVVFVVNRITFFLYPRCNKALVNHMCLLLATGCLILTRLVPSKAERQLYILIVSLVLFFVIPFWIKKIKFWKHFSVLYGSVGILALYVVFAFGDTVYGSKLSFEILGMTFQPSEFVKIIFAFFIGALLYKKPRIGKVIPATFAAAIYVLLLVVSKDLGSALIFYIMYIGMLYVATGRKRYYVLGIGGGCIAALIAGRLFSHVQTRIAVWLDPWSDLDNTGYQLTQSLFGIGTGGWLGMGIGKGRPDTIPFVEEDFIFSAIAEELGAIFAIFLICAYFICIAEVLKTAFKLNDSFWKIVAVGLASSLGAQTVLTIGGGTGLIPLTGVTLPLVSNGGSSGMATVLTFAILVGISLVQGAEKKDVLVTAKGNTDEDNAGEEFTTELSEEELLLEKAFQEKKRQRTAVGIIIAVFLAFFIAMIVNIVYFMLVKKDEVISNSYNGKRLEILAANTTRGTIYGNEGEVLAETILDAQGEEIRHYPYGELFAHAVGYSDYGAYGVESIANASLIMSNLTLTQRVSNEINGVKNPGDNVFTSLDPELQQVAYDSLGVYRGAIIVTEVETGRILAMVSKPDFDPNLIGEIWEETIADEDSTVFLNRVTQGLYPPGSTFKIFTALEYMRQNPEDYMNYHFVCGGYFRLGDYRINCYHGSVHGNLDLVTSFAKSCNASFANIGVTLDRTEFAETLLTLGFNTSLPLQMPSSPSHISMRESMNDNEIMQTAIGQSETLITPIHLNMVTQAIANDGVMMVPYLIDRIETADGMLVRSYEPQVYGVVMTSDEAEYLTMMMQAVVESGTASKLSGQTYTAAGKTGSAEYSEEENSSHAWFTGFAPVENPQIAVTIILEGAGTGGDYSAPIARRIFSCYFGE